jgi:hypothetical protein
MSDILRDSSGDMMMASLADASLDTGAGDFVNAMFLCPSLI